MNNAIDRDSAITRIKARRGLNQLALVAVLVSAVTIVVWLAIGGGYFWPMWPMLGLGIGLLAAAWQVWGPGERPISEADIAEEVRRG